MRIKSYFAPSVQSAISIARREFGDDVTLVTSHTAALESRHLGDYEVVFAVEETPESAISVPAKSETKKTGTQLIKATAMGAGASTATAVVEVPEPLPATATPEPVVPEPSNPEPFNNLFQQAIATPLSTEENLPEKLARVETLLVEMGIDGPMVRALMTMIERSAGVTTPAPVAASANASPEAEAITEPTATETIAPEMEPAAAAMPDLTPAELAFYLSVSVAA